MNILRSAAAQTAIEHSSNQNLINKQHQNETSNFSLFQNASLSQSIGEDRKHGECAESVDYDMKKFQSDFSDLVKSNMKLIFEQFDKDNDGKITRNELNFVMRNLFPDEEITEQDITEMLHAADLDKNGFIDFDGKRHWKFVNKKRGHEAIGRLNEGFFSCCCCCCCCCRPCSVDFCFLKASLLKANNLHLNRFYFERVRQHVQFVHRQKCSRQLGQV